MPYCRLKQRYWMLQRGCVENLIQYNGIVKESGLVASVYSYCSKPPNEVE